MSEQSESASRGPQTSQLRSVGALGIGGREISCGPGRQNMLQSRKHVAGIAAGGACLNRRSQTGPVLRRQLNQERRCRAGTIGNSSDEGTILFRRQGGSLSRIRAQQVDHCSSNPLMALTVSHALGSHSFTNPRHQRRAGERDHCAEDDCPTLIHDRTIPNPQGGTR